MLSRHWFAIVLPALLVACQPTHMESNSAMPLPSADEIVQTLDLEQHVEGGYFRRTYQADHRPLLELPEGGRYLMSSIFYLLTEQSPVGHFHLNKSDIVHYYHLGDPIRYYLIHPSGQLEKIVMGHDVTKGHHLQLTVKGGVWKASRLLEGPAGYGLISEAVSPGFDFADMILGEETALRQAFPRHSALFKALTRE